MAENLDKKEYEAYFIINPHASEERREAIIERAEKKVKENGAEKVETERQGLRKLAFKFQKHPDLKDGYFVLMRFWVKPAGIAPLQELFRLTEEVVRFQVTLAVPKPEIAEKKEEKVEISAAVLEGGEPVGQS